MKLDCELKLSLVVNEIIKRYVDGSGRSFRPHPIMKEAFRHGHHQALQDFGIWKDGQQLIGAMGHDVKEVMRVVDEELCIGGQ